MDVAGQSTPHWRGPFNLQTKWTLLGQPQGAGFNRYEEYSANFTRYLTLHVGLTGEVYGDTQSGSGHTP